MLGSSLYFLSLSYLCRHATVVFLLIQILLQLFYKILSYVFSRKEQLETCFFHNFSVIGLFQILFLLVVSCLSSFRFLKTLTYNLVIREMIADFYPPEGKKELINPIEFLWILRLKTKYLKKRYHDIILLLATVNY